MDKFYIDVEMAIFDILDWIQYINKYNIQAYLEDIAGSVPDHHNKGISQ